MYPQFTPTFAAPSSYSPVPTTELKLEKEEERVAEDADIEIWIQKSMAQVAALQQYGVICIVLSGFSFSGLFAMDHQTIKEEMNYTVGGFHVGSGLVFALTLSMAIGICCGIYATLIFTLCSIYGAVAVSHGDQDGFLSFMSRTGSIRTWAFRAFKGSLVSMIASIVLVLFTTIPALYALIVVIPALGISIGAVWHASSVMSYAKSEFGHSSLAAYHRPGSSGAVGKEQEGVDEDSDGDYDDSPLV